ncbi:MAG: response regulator [Lachnospiraceae bacterium]|jgi:putative two-component system response regulator|nr:response regulator [Lachnospiraceae bacterium]
MDRHKMLIVDDLESNRMVLAEIFRADYQILQAEDTATTLQLLEKQNKEIAAVLLDWHLSGEDGNKILESMKKKGWMNHIPVLIVTAENSTEVEKKCIQMGASDLIRKPFDAEVVKNRVNNNISLYMHKNQMEEKVQEQNQMLRKQYAVMKLQAEKLKKSNEKMIDIVCNILEHHYPEFSENTQITREISRIIGKKVQQNYPEYKLTDKDVEAIAELSSLRDIGKLLISDHVLYKPAKLTKEEAEYMKSHTSKGCEIMKMMKDLQSPDYHKKSLEICRYHHERYDGTGYPEGLKGDEIPISAQIVSVVDAYHALISERIYKRSYSREEAYYMILGGECGIFSPKIMECFRMSRKEMEAINTDEEESA